MAIQFFSPVPIIASSSGNLSRSASSGGGSNASVVLAANTSGARVQQTIHSIAWSYSTTPPTAQSGFVRVYNGTTAQSLVFEHEITSAAPDSHVFFPPITATPGRPITCVLLQAGSSVIGYLQAYGRVQ